MKGNSIVEQLKTTPIVQVACQKAGISRATYYRWRKNDPEFKKNTDSSLREGIGFINDLAESQLISLIKDKHPSSIYYWLNHRHPKYSDKRLLLPISDQRQLIKNIFSSNKEDSYLYILEKMIKGSIPENVFRSMLPAISKIGRDKTDETDWAISALHTLIDKFSTLKKEEPKSSSKD